MPGEASSTTTVETRRLAAIMFTDMVGFSRQMGSDEARMLRLLNIHNQIIQHAVAEHHGAIIKIMGDAFLVDFPSVVHAVQCAQQIQSQLRAHNAEKAKDEQLHVRIGIHSGDIIQKEGDVFGDGVNIAARLQSLAEPDTICISDIVYRDVVKKLDLSTVVALGRPQLKNIAERFQVYALLPEPPKSLRQQLQVQRLKLSRRVRPTHRLALAGVALLLVGGFASSWFFSFSLSRLPSPVSQTHEGLSLPDKPSIVVLPFTNMSNDPAQEYFSDGITEDITTGLAKLSSLFVIARNSAFTYKGKAVKVQDVSREMGVRYVLEGSVRRTDEQIRITAQLIDGLTGSHLWAERFDRPLKDIFAVQDEIVQKIVTTLKLQLSIWEQGFRARKNTDSLEAYDAYLRGVEAFTRAVYESKREANEQARQMFEKAIMLDPTYAEAYANLGRTYFLEWRDQWNKDRSQTLEHALELAQKAVALDDSLSDPHQVLSLVYLMKKQHEQAIAEAQRVIALVPNAAEGYWRLGQILPTVGRAEEAIGLIEKAMRLNPHYPIWYLLDLGIAYNGAGRYEEALVTLKKALTRNPDFALAHLSLAICYVELGRLEEARIEGAELLRLNPHWSLESVRQIAPYKDPAAVERMIAALRKAGLK